MIMASYGLITEHFELNTYMVFLLGVFMLIIGLEELRKSHKKFWYMSIVISLFSFFVSIQSLFIY
ncbi:DUF3953 domain-containing protein [Paenibacillus crassostreae]|uniref:DUF3953 domain-containing protein n=2 Tax=Paenibacillus crassostreae TaxID=1763538 RepID=A0A167E304_9BACL|nr:hypothetical protein PNBC_09350 [Paenibacillus crassostreae]